VQFLKPSQQKNNNIGSWRALVKGKVVKRLSILKRSGASIFPIFKGHNAFHLNTMKGGEKRSHKNLKLTFYSQLIKNLMEVKI